MNPLTWTKAQWDAAGRHLLTVIGTATPLLIAFKLITPEQAGFWTATGSQIFAAVGALCVAVAPVYAAYKAAKSASPENQAAQTVANLEKGVPMNGKRDLLIEAVANQPDVKKVELVDKAKADAISSQKVV